MQKPIVELTSMSSVSALNLVVTQSGFPGVAQASFELPEKHFTIVTGANGSGKTTLLKAISGQMPISRGQINIGELKNESHNHPRKLKQQSVYVGHNPLFMRHVSVIEHLELCQAFDSSNSQEDPSFVLSIEEILNSFNLENRKEVRVENLSAGQQRRLHLASALVRRAKLLCIDEPHASLDEVSKIDFDEIVKQQFEMGRNFLIATHDPKRLIPIATHEITLINGVAELEEFNK